MSVKPMRSRGTNRPRWSQTDSGPPEKVQPGNPPHKARMVLEISDAEPKSWREPVDMAELMS